MQNTFISYENLRRFLEHLNMNNTASLETHTNNFNNPHNVTKEQVGLGNVDNTSDVNKPLSNAQKGYIDSQDNMILTNAELYTDAAKTSAINTASADATTKSNAVQNDLNSHISNVTDAHDMANRLQALKTLMTGYVDQSISKVVDGSPELLNTLNEFAKALGDNPNFATTYTNLLGQKLDSSEVVTTPIANKILRLDASAQFPPSVIAQDMYNRLFTDAERAKLAAIADNANNYIHPVTHPPSIIAQDETNRFVTDIEKSKWNGKQDALGLVTSTVDGIMRASDKFKLDNIENGADKTIITNDLTTSITGTALDASQGKILNDTKAPTNHASTTNTYGWGDTTNKGHVAVSNVNGLSVLNGLVSMALATRYANGAFSSTDKEKLDGIEDNATNYIHPLNHPPTIISQDENNRFVTDAEKSKWNGKQDALGLVTTSSNGIMSAVDKLKLDGIAVNANNYIHPDNHPPTIISQDENNRFVTDIEKAKWNAAETNANLYTDNEIATQSRKQRPIGSAGQVYYIKDDNSPEVELSQILTTGRFVENSTELMAELAKVISFGTIFNTWERFNIAGTAGEENAWSYNSTTDQVSCTVNSNGFIGFTSLNKYDNYSHEVTLSAADTDDDLIGVIIAYYKDPNTGKKYTLHASRSTKLSNTGNGPCWGVIYNWAQADQVILAGGDNILLPSTGTGWSTTGATRLRITRKGDIITCESTPFGNVTSYQDAYKYTIDLTSNPLLDVFRGPKSYGYCCQSQAMSTFSNISFSDISSMIFDLSGNKVMTFKSGTWVSDSTKSIISEVGAGRLLSNPTTGKLFFIKDANTIIPITTKVPLANNLTTTVTGTALDAAQGKILNDTKEPSITAGTATQYWRGNKTWADLGTDIRSTILNGLTITNAVITAADTILTAPGKLQGQITAHVGSKGVAQHGLGDGTNAGFSTNDYTTTEKTKLAAITVGNAAGNVPINNGILNATLNADLFDSLHSTAFMKLDGTQALVAPTQNNIGGKSDVVHYKDLGYYSNINGAVTGTIKITLPFTWNKIMGQYIIKGYDRSTNGHWEIRITGYNDSITSGWCYCTADAIGSPPFTSVRMGHDGTKCCILLGTLTTVWQYPQMALTDFIAAFAAQTGWQPGPWLISVLTAETGIASIVTPVFRQEVNTANLQAALNALPNI